MEITIGIRNVQREVTVESSLGTQEAHDAVAAAIESGTALTLEDDRGRRVIVPANAIGYVTIGTDEPRRVGFGAIATS